MHTNHFLCAVAITLNKPAPPIESYPDNQVLIWYREEKGLSQWHSFEHLFVYIGGEDIGRKSRRPFRKES